jgi:hypothetical protein
MPLDEPSQNQNRPRWLPSQSQGDGRSRRSALVQDPFIANLDLMASDDEEERDRGKRMFSQNADWYTRLFLPTRQKAAE